MTAAHIVLGAPSTKHFTIEKFNEEDLFIGVDRGALILLEAGIEPNLAIGDFDSVSEEEFQRIEKSAGQVKQFDSEKDDTDTELAIKIAQEQYNPDEFLFYNWIGGRMDHLISLIFIIFQPRYYGIIDQMKFINKKNTISFYKPGSYRLLKEEDKKYLSFIGMTSLEKLSLSQVKYPLKDIDYDYPKALVSNEFIGEEAYFSFEKGILAVVQAAD